MQFVLGYLDPGTGSLLLQALVGGFAGIWVFLKFVWHRLRGKTSSVNQLPDDAGKAEAVNAEAVNDEK
jgi:hypothetical protein